MSPPTPAELVALEAYISEGSIKAAAHKLNLAPSTVHNQLATLRRRMGAKTTAEVVYRLLRDEAA